MSMPKQSCLICGDTEVCRLSGRAFPPDAALRRLAKRCEAKGHLCQSQYTAGSCF